MRVTSSDLQTLDISPTKIWGKLIKTHGRFTAVYTENVFGNLKVIGSPKLKEWW